MSTRVGIKQQLVRVEAVARLWLVWPMYTIPVNCSGSDVGKIPVPDLVRIFRQFDSLYFSLLGIKEANFNLRGMRREQGEIGPTAVPGSAAWKRIPLFNLYFL